MKLVKRGKVYDLEKYQSSADKYNLYLSGPTSIITIDNPNTKTKKELIKKIPSLVTARTIRGLASKLCLETEYGDGGFIYGYYLFDTYDEAYLEIITSGIFYGAYNDEEIKIKINFRNADERFEYGAYLILSNYLK